MHPEVALVLSCIWQQMPSDASRQRSWWTFGLKSKTVSQQVGWLSCACAAQLEQGSVTTRAASPSLQAANVQQPDECTVAAHAISIMGLLPMLSQS